MNAWSLSPLIAFFINSALGILVVSRDWKSPVNRTFGFLVVVFSVWTFAEFMLRISDASGARAWATVQYAGIVFIPPAFYYFAVVFTGTRLKNRIWTRFTWVLLGVSTVLLLSLGTSLFIARMIPYLDSYRADFGPIYDFFSIYFIGILLAGLVILAWRWRKSTTVMEKHKSAVVLVAASISSIGGTISDVILVPTIHGFYPLASTLTIGTTLIMAYGIMRYKLFFIEPAAEISTDGSVPLEKGYIYFVPEEKPEKCYELFAETVKSGVYGLCLTVNNPAEIREKYGLEKTPIVNMSKDGNGKTVLDPTEALSESAYNNIKKFISQANDSVILVDDPIPIIFGRFSTTKERMNTLDDVNRFADLIIKSDSRLIVSVKPSLLTPAGNKIIKTKTPIRFSPALNAAILEKVCTDEFRAMEKLHQSKMIEDMMHYLKTTNELSAGLEYEKGAVKFDYSNNFSNDKLFDLLRGFAAAYEDTTRRDARTPIFETLEKYGYNKYELFLKTSGSYIIPEPESDSSTAIFRKFIENGYAGLCITRTFPGNIRFGKTPDGVRMKTYWLTDTKTGDDIIPPRPEYVKKRIEDFLGENKESKSIILLDGLEYLITHGGDSFDSTLTLMNIVSDILAESNALLIAPVRPSTLSSERFNLLSKSMKEFVPPE